MSKRKYIHIQVLLPEIKAMIASGKSHREIEEFFGLTGDRPIHNLLKRELGLYLVLKDTHAKIHRQETSLQSRHTRSIV